MSCGRTILNEIFSHWADYLQSPFK